MSVVTFRLSPLAQMCLGIDDSALVREAYPSLVETSDNVYTAELVDAGATVLISASGIFQTPDPAAAAATLAAIARGKAA